MYQEIADTRLGRFLIIPLKYDTECIKDFWLKEVGENKPISTMGINEAIKNNLIPALAGGDPIAWLVTISSLLLMTIGTAIVILWKKRE